MDELNEVRLQFRQQQEKFVYYTIALSVAAIGFSITATKDQPLSCSHIFVALSILSWAFSVFFGFRFIKLTISTLFSNHVYIQILNGTNPEVGNNINMIKAASEGVKSAMESNSRNANKSLTIQEILFYLGIVFYLVWHVIEMYKNIL